MPSDDGSELVLRRTGLRTLKDVPGRVAPLVRELTGVLPPVDAMPEAVWDFSTLSDVLRRLARQPGSSV